MDGREREYRLGVDLGGTFTDVCVWDVDAQTLHAVKVPSSPDDPAGSVLEGVDRALSAAGTSGRVTYLGHGTTIGTNALIERTGAPTAVVTTAGFRDVLELARQRRPHLYDLQAEKPEPLVRRNMRFEVAERVLADGTVERALDEGDVRRAARDARAGGAAAVAVCFLHSYVDGAHEDTARRIIEEELPSVFVTSSHEVVPEFREYERLSTVVINAYLGPVVSRYLVELAPRLRDAGIDATPMVTQSNGGVISFETAAVEPVRTVLSGPSTGIVASAHIGRLAGFTDLITFDMGGTSTDVAVVVDGEPSTTARSEVAGYPITTLMLGINTIGAGGGSIAWIDSGGHLKVGPESAGAVPGPACYGRGGTAATVTDADVVLGTANPRRLAGGAVLIDPDLARDAISSLAARLGRSVEETANGVIDVVTANMARAIRAVTIDRGHDPRDFTLVAFGGAGPLHAGRLARSLDIQRVLVPASPGVHCALGLLLTDLKRDFSLTRPMVLGRESWSELTRAVRALERTAEDWFDSQGVPAARRSMRVSLEMRYVGQNYELPVPMCEAGLAVTEAVAELRRRFVAAHTQAYGHAAEDQDVQVVTFRCEAIALSRKAELPTAPAGGAPPRAADEREVFLPEAGGWVRCGVFERSALGGGHTLAGPVVIEQPDSTVLVLPDQRVDVDPYGDLIVTERR